MSGRWKLGIGAAVMIALLAVTPVGSQKAVAADVSTVSADSNEEMLSVSGSESTDTADVEDADLIDTENTGSAEDQTADPDGLEENENYESKQTADILSDDTAVNDESEMMNLTVILQKDGVDVSSENSLSVILATSVDFTYRVDGLDETSSDSASWSSSDESVILLTANEDGSVTLKAVGSGQSELTLTLTLSDTDEEQLTVSCTINVAAQNGFYQDENGGWYYAKNGQIVTSDVVKDANGVVDGTKNRWWYVCDSKVGCEYYGFAQNSNGWWYIEDGYVTFSKNSVIKDTNKVIDGAATWWYVVGSKVQTDFTGLANYKNENGWWYIENGKVTFTKNTVAKNKNGWWYVTGSKVQFGFTGLANYKNENGWWYIKNGKEDFSKNTVAKNKNGWYYVTGGKVQFGYTGLANYKNENGWWYIKNGKVDFTYAGVAKNKNGWWYLSGGKVIFDDAMTYAARFIGAHTTTSQSDSEKLSACFTYLWKNYSYKRYYDSPTASTVSSFAVDMLKNKEGNCFRYAAAFACIAKALGYESRIAVGKISSTHGGMTAHGWTEVCVNGTWYICDANMQRNYPTINSYMRTESTYAYTHSCSARYTITISNGKVVWK